MILAIRTDNPLAEIYLCDLRSSIDSIQWEAHRQLTDTIHVQIEALMQTNQKSWDDISGVIVFKGPGSFTGLRIGITVANTIAYAQHVPVIGVAGDRWLEEGLNRLSDHQNDTIVIPEYGSDIHITTPKK